jgi:hypothetical protein
MTGRAASRLETKFEEPGSLERPGPVGRVVRLLLGALVLWPVISIVPRAQFVADWTAPTHFSWWLAVALSLWLFPYVVNIGFTRSWRWRPRAVAAAVLVGAPAVSLALTGRWWSPAVGTIYVVWLAYTFGHLALSFFVASVIGTPGCEMRALPHLWSVLTGRTTKEHYCPGMLDPVDRWEAARRAAAH